jgi:LacI family transcriptional regulator
VWLAASNYDPSIEAAQVEQMTHHPVDGILLVPVDSRRAYLKALAAGTTPVVTIDRPIELGSTNSVETENRFGARVAVDHLVGHGRKRIVCVATNSHLRTIKARIGGYEESLRSAKLPRAKPFLLSNLADTKASLSELFASRNRRDGLFTANNASTIWVIETLRDMKIKIGKDVSLVGIDDVDFYTLITPPITAVRQPAAELGRVSVRLLMQRIKGDSSPSGIRTVLPVSLVIRESCGCKRRR